jgi:hypothetical protein
MKQKRKNRTIPFVPIAIVVVVAIATALVVQHYHKPVAIPTTPSGVKLTPPTAQEKAQGNENKSTIVQQEQQQTTQTPAGTKKQVTVTITNASNSSVNAFVSGVFEDGGTCTATFTQGSTTITRTATAFSNVSDTQCPPITPNLPNANQWSVVVSYSSAAAQGTSPSQTF